MVTIAPGQLIQEQPNERIWRILERSQSRDYGVRWFLEVVEAGTDGMRHVGQTTRASERWINEHCVDWPLTTQAPCGDGPQTVRIAGWDMLVMETAVEAVAWFTENLDRGDHGHWWGFATDDEASPDMNVCWNEAGDELVWSEA